MTQSTRVVTGSFRIFMKQIVSHGRKRDKLEDRPPYGRIQLFVKNSELYEVTPAFLKRVWDLDLYNIFISFKGADLLYACIAKV